MNKTELKTIMRTDKAKIIELSNFIRQWLNNKKDNLGKELVSHKCEYVNFYNNEKKFVD